MSDLRERLAIAEGGRRNGLASDGGGWFRTDEDRAACFAVADTALAAVRECLTAPETVERVARVWTAEVPPIQHGQLCPCWTKKASAERCDCFVVFNRRSLASSAVTRLAAVLAPEEGESHA